MKYIMSPQELNAYTNPPTGFGAGFISGIGLAYVLNIVFVAMITNSGWIGVVWPFWLLWRLIANS